MTERQYRFWQWGVVAAALLVRLPLLTGSFWLDEAAQALESARPLTQQFSLAGDFQPPLFHLLVALLVRISREEWWLRLSSLLPAVGTVWLVMGFCRRWLDRKGSLLVGLAVAFSSLFVFYSQELRPYSLAVFWAILAWKYFEEQRWRKLCLVATLGIFTSYVYLFWLAALLAVSIVKRQLKPTFKALSVASLFFLSWWPHFLEQLRVGQQLRMILPGWEAVVSLPQLKAGLLVPTKFLTGLLPLDWLSWQIVLIGGSLALILSVVLWDAWSASRTDQGRVIQWSILLALPFVAAWLTSFFTPVLQPKRVLWLVLPTAVFLGWLGRRRSQLGKLVIGLYFLWQTVGLIGYWTQPSWQRENWRTAITQIDSQFSATNTAIVFGFSNPFSPWEWYPHQAYQTYSTGLSPLRDLEQVRAALT